MLATASSSLAPPPTVLSAVEPSSSIRREARFIGSGEQSLFARFHACDDAVLRDCVVVLCNPFGHEQVHSHRSVRHLADALARAGVPALRFDFHGTGDSPGTDHDADRLAQWQRDIHTAVAEAKRLSGCPRVCLLGIRLGGTLAALSTVTDAADLLVMWGAPLSGRRYAREMQALAQASELAPRPDATQLEPAGFVISQQTQNELKAVKLVGQPLQVRSAALIVQRDDASDEDGLLEHLQSLGVAASVIQGAGFAGMMAEPHRVTVPQATLSDIVDWVVAHSEPAPMVLTSPSPRTTLPAPTGLDFHFTGLDNSTVTLRETLVTYGDHGSLFGVHSRPAAAPDGEALPTVILFSSGAVHRVGPSRLYTTLARNLAARGYATFRCDLEGIGDSVAQQPGLEGHPYPPTAMRDADHTLRHLQEHFNAQQFVLAGVCSGSYTAFQAALEQPTYTIHDLLLINPLIFEYDGKELPDVQSFRIAESSKGAMRKLDSWKKLLRGQMRVGYLLGMAARHVGRVTGSHLRTAAELVTSRAATLLSRQLQQLFDQKRRVTVFLANGEAGWSIMQAGARRTTQRGVRHGNLRLFRIDEADHTFSSEHARDQLLNCMLHHLDDRFQKAPSPTRHVVMKSLLLCAALVPFAPEASWAADKPQPKGCAELKAEIAAKMDSRGLKGYTLEVVDAGKVGDSKVVGTCERGSKKVTYKK
ncbi:MAG: hypothetical protein RLZZ618_2181 [Pseudomonadota bacterium]